PRAEPVGGAGAAPAPGALTRVARWCSAPRSARWAPFAGVEARRERPPPSIKPRPASTRRQDPGRGRQEVVSEAQIRRPGAWAGSRGRWRAGGRSRMKMGLRREGVERPDGDDRGAAGVEPAQEREQL